jgi:hypothetical protein
VFGGLKELAEEEEGAVFSGSSLPQWLVKAANRGRNVIAIKERIEDRENREDARFTNLLRDSNDATKKYHPL